MRLRKGGHCSSKDPCIGAIAIKKDVYTGHILSFLRLFLLYFTGFYGKMQ